MARRTGAVDHLALAGAVIGLAVAFTSGCGRRQVAYHFRAPLVGAVSAAPLPERAREGEPARPRDRTSEVALDANLDRQARIRARARAGTPAHLAPPPRRLAVPAEALTGSSATGDDLAASLRQTVGRHHDESTHVQFALAALRTLGAHLDSTLVAVTDGPVLRALAAERGALVAAGEASPVTVRPHLGDLLLFDRVTATRPASLVAVVVTVDSRGVIEFVYLARGVVRRGFVAAARPSDKRDADGRVLNTFVRHSDGRDPRGTRYLAGELLAAVIRLDRLLR